MMVGRSCFVALCAVFVLLGTGEALGDDRTGESASARATAEGAGAGALVFEKRWEPREKAFSVMVPRGWKTEGGTFHINPLETNGPGNSIDTKCDFTVKRDDAGTVYIRWLPTWNYADLSSPQFAMTAGFFPPGSHYQGMPVRPLPGVFAFLQETFPRLHPRATGVKVVEKHDMPELAAVYRRLNKPVNDMMAPLGLPPMGFSAGGIVLEYQEGGVRYREALLAALVDNRGGAASWSNQHTLALRAPSAEAERWKPVLDIVRRSLRFNPQWVAAYARAQGERAQMARETMEYIQRIDQEILENRRKTHADIRHENYLFLTGQEEYVNPYTREVERDTSEFKHRWTNFNGDRIYSEDRDFDPNKVRELNNVEWKKTPVRER